MFLATLPAVFLLNGCGGVRTNQSVSPASFFLPGLLKISPPATTPDGNAPGVISGEQTTNIS